jgi:hypothetical protein
MPAGYKKAGSGAAFWVIIIVIGIAVAFGAWFYLKGSQKPAKASPNQSRIHWTVPYTPAV